MDADIKKICRCIDTSDFVAESDHHYRELFTPKSTKIFHDHYRKDFAMFGYKMDPELTRMAIPRTAPRAIPRAIPKPRAIQSGVRDRHTFDRDCNAGQTIVFVHTANEQDFIRAAFFNRDFR